MATGFQLEHAQIGAVGETPTYVDLPAIDTWNPVISSNRSTLPGDGGIYAATYGARDGQGDIVNGFLAFPAIVIANGATLSSSGTGATKIDRLVQSGKSISPAFITSAFYRNASLDKDPTLAVRVTTPVTTAGPVSAPLGQETWVKWTMGTSFVADDDDQMIIYEKLAALPVLTAGVMPVNITAPTP